MLKKTSTICARAFSNYCDLSSKRFVITGIGHAQFGHFPSSYKSSSFSRKENRELEARGASPVMDDARCPQRGRKSVQQAGNA